MKLQWAAGGAGLAALLLACSSVVAQTSPPSDAGIQQLANRAKALASSLSGASPEAASNKSALDYWLGAAEPAQRPVTQAGVRQDQSAPSAGNTLPAPLQQCAGHAAMAADEMARFAKHIAASVARNPNAKPIRDLQERMGIDIPGMLAQAGQTLRGAGRQMGAQGDPGRGMRQCLQASGIAKQVTELVKLVPPMPAIGSKNVPTLDLDALERLATFNSNPAPTK